jgi:hypothetical protein
VASSSPPAAPAPSPPPAFISPSFPPPPQAPFLRRHAGKFLASALIGIGLVAMLQKSGLKILPTGVSFATIRWWTLPIYVVTLTGMNFFRATRWRFLLRKVVDVPLRRLVIVSWIGFAAILLMPFRLGEFVRPYMLRSGGKAPGRDGQMQTISLTMATGSVVAERVADLAYLSIVLAIALIFVPTVQPLPMSIVGLDVPLERVRQAGFGMLGLSAIAVTVIAVYYFAREWARRATLAVFGLVSRPLGEKLASMAEKFADGLHFLGHIGDAIPFLLETTAYWFLNVLGMWILAWGCNVVHADGTAITLAESCSLMGLLGVTILVPGPPGLLGVFQLGIYAGMTMYYPESIVIQAGAAYVFLLYATQFIWTLVAGGGCLLLERNSVQTLKKGL